MNNTDILAQLRLLLNKVNGDPCDASEFVTLVQGTIEALGGATIEIVDVVTIEPGEEARVENTGTDQALKLVFYIPKGADGVTPTIDPTTRHWMIGGVDTGILAQGSDGQDGQDGAPGHNPCLGRFASMPSTFAETPRAGDYYFVDTVDTSTTPPTVTETKIYKYDGTQWDSGTVVDVSNLTFATSEEVTNVAIDGTHLANPLPNALAKAEDVLRINGTVIREVEAQVENRDWRPSGETMGGYWLTDNTWARSASNYKSALVPIPSGTTQIRFNTIIKTSAGVSQLGFAFLDDTEELLGDVMPIPTVVGGTSPMDYTVRVPEGAAYMVSTCKTANWSGENAYWYLQYREDVLDIINEVKEEIPESVQYGLPILDATKAVSSYDFVKTLIDASYDVVTLTDISSKNKIRYTIKPSGKYGTVSTSSHVCVYVVNAEIVYINAPAWLYVAFVSGSNPVNDGDLMLTEGESVKVIGAGERYYKVPKEANLMLMFNSNNEYPNEIKIFRKKEIDKQPLKPIVEYNNIRGDAFSSGVKGFVTRLEAKKKYNLFFKNSGTGTKYIKLIDDIPATTVLDTQTFSVANKRIEITPTQNCYVEVTKGTGASVLDTVTVEEVLDDLDFKCEVNEFRSKAVQEASLSGLTIINGQALQEINVLKRAKQFTDILWTPKHTFYGKTQNNVYSEGVEQTNGIPYSNNFTDYKIVGQTVSIHTFMTAINNPYSMIYTERVKDGASESVWGRTYYGPNGYAYYGAVCCSFTSWCHGFKGNLGNPGYIWFSRYFGLTKAYDIRGKFDVNLLRVGDVLNSWEHAVIITGITRGENGEVTTIHLAECGGGVGNVGGCHVFSNTPTQFKTTMRVDRTDPMEIMTLYRANGLYRNTEYTPSPYVVLEGETAQTVVYNNDICTVYGDKASLAEGYRVVLNYDLDGNHGAWTGIKVYKNNEIVDTYTLSNIDQSALPEGQRSHALDLGNELTAGLYKACMTDGTNDSDYTYWEIVSNDVDVEALGEGKYRITNNTGKEMIDCVIGIYRGDDLGMERADISYPLKLEDIQANQFTMNLRAWLQATNKSVALPYVIKLVLQGEYTGVATAVIQLPDINY